MQPQPQPRTTGQDQPERGWTAVARYTLGSLFGAALGGVFVIGVTSIIKAMLAVVSRQETWVLIALPVAAVAAATAVLHGIGRGEAAQRLTPTPPMRRVPRRRRSRRWYLPRIPLA
jgi:hypothetical protein